MINVVGVCKDCKWWDKALFGGDAYGFCRLAEPAPTRATYHIPSLAYVDKRDAMLVTSPHFGCIQFTDRIEDSEEDDDDGD